MEMKRFAFNYINLRKWSSQRYVDQSIFFKYLCFEMFCLLFLERLILYINKFRLFQDRKDRDEMNRYFVKRTSRRKEMLIFLLPCVCELIDFSSGVYFFILF